MKGHPVAFYAGMPELLREVCGFNFLALDYAHPAWVEQHIPFSVPSDMGVRGRLAISRLLLSSVGAADPFWGFGEIPFRIALLPARLLHRLMVLAGGARFWKPVSMLIDGPSISRLRRGIGADLYDFMVGRAPLMVPERLCLDGVPEGEDDLTAEGWRLLWRIFGEAPDALRIRLLLKFPPGCRGPGAGTADVGRDEAATIFKKLTLFEAGAQWSEFFIG